MSMPNSGSPRKSRHGYTAWRCCRPRHFEQRKGTSDSQHGAQANTARVQLHSIVSVLRSLHPTQGPSSCFMIAAPSCRADRVGNTPRPTLKKWTGALPRWLQSHRHDHGQQPRTVRRHDGDRALALIVGKLELHPNGFGQALKRFREVPDVETADRHRPSNG